MSAPFFSIIIPTLNEEAFLPKLLQDLTGQNFPSFEVLIVDAHSTDNTKKNIDKTVKRDARFSSHFCPQKNVSWQRNIGATRAAGTWLLFLDADSRISKNFLHRLAVQLRIDVCDGFTCHAKADEQRFDSLLFVWVQNFFLDLMIKIGAPYSVGACMGSSRSIFKKIGGFDRTIAHMEDSEFARRLYKNGFQFRVLHSPTFIYSLRRQRKGGMLSFLIKLVPYYIKSFVQSEYKTPKSLYPMHGGSDMHLSTKSRI